MKKLLIFLICFVSSLHAEYKYDLSIGAIFQNEAPYLKEWIEFHRLMGVQHFYLYNHLSTDHYKKVLKPYIDSGLVDLYKLPKKTRNVFFNTVQCSVYTEIVRNNKGISKWIAFLDIDEFLFPVTAGNLNDFLKNYEDCPGVCVNWQIFGTSNIGRIPEDRLMIEMLTHCAPMEEKVNFHVKSIVRPEFVDFFENPHFAVYIKEFAQVNTDKIPFSGPFSPYIQVNALRINHYWTRDHYYMLKFKIPRRLKWDANAKQVVLSENKIYNKEKNKLIFRFIPLLKEVLLK